jgi:hypothetical protein
MKKIVILLMMIFMGVEMMAQNWNKALLRIREERGRAITVTIDGRRYPKMGRSLTVNDLAPGRHLLKIHLYNSNGHGYTNSILIYQGDIMVKPGRIYYCTVSRRALDIEENCCIDNYGHWNNNDNWQVWEDQDDTWNNNQQWNNDPSDNYNQNTWNDYSGVMSNGRFDLLIQQIRKASFESSKVTVANQALRNNKITVNQMIGILNEFSFESTKLKFAKDNYRSVVNRRDYFMINDVFTFQSSKDELAEFLNRQER